ncbi:MAG: metal-dependent transcriptional regulator [Bacteroidota bacterium]
MTPFETLLVGTLVLAICAIFAWPRKGLIARWRRAAERSARILVEDALKHLYDYEYRKMPSTLESLAGTLSISGDEAVKLISRLEGLRLVERRNLELRLTTGGRSYALRVIRLHRLWERYLADETNVREAEWHTEAELKEHAMTVEEANAIARKLGDPLYDPHGDPIPTVAGTLPSHQGVPLTSLKVSEVAAIVHVEDEPAAIYAQLVAVGLFPGMQVRMIGQSPDRVVFDAAGNEVILAPVVAANISVVTLPVEAVHEGPFLTLASLAIGERGMVTGLSPACRGTQRRRLMDLGVVPGTMIEAELRSPGGDPTAYRIRGATIALRQQQADLVYISEPTGTA